MQTNTSRAAIAALLVPILGAVAQAAPSFHSPLKKAVQALKGGIEEDKIAPYQWMLPSVIQAGLVERGVSVFVGDAYATFRGRSFNMETDQVGVGVTDWLQILYGNQYILAKGRQSTSRFDVAANYYSVRAVVKRPTAADPSALSLQFQAIRPDTGSAVEAGSSEEFAGTHNNVGSVNYLDRQKNQFQVQYTNVNGPDGVSANVYSVGWGRDYELNELFLARVQASMIGESYQAIGSSSNSEFKPLLYGCVAFQASDNLSLELDLTCFPSGIPLAGGDFTAISSFDLYNPGGVVSDLRSDFSAFASLRVMYHTKF